MYSGSIQTCIIAVIAIIHIISYDMKLYLLENRLYIYSGILR